MAELTGGQAGPCVALRADIDALPLSEEGNADYASVSANVMHACGHDAHISILLGAAKLLSSQRGEIPGTIRFIFQPAEEHGIRSGAVEMIAGGALDGVGAIAGLHLWSFVETGRVQFRSGPVMASADRWMTRFTGRGGHGAMPHETEDPTIALASFITAIQTIASRETNPLDSVVVSAGRLRSGDAYNIIPTFAEAVGSLRSFTPEARRGMEERLRRIADGIGAAHRCAAETKVDYLYPSLVNHQGPTELLRRTAEAVVGRNMTEESPMLMVSEDFSFYLQKTPGTFFFLGSGNAEKGTDFPHHSSRFDVDDDALPIGITLLAAFSFAALNKLASGGFAEREMA
jgi:amidohydrolase